MFDDGVGPVNTWSGCGVGGGGAAGVSSSTYVQHPAGGVATGGTTGGGPIEQPLVIPTDNDELKQMLISMKLTTGKLTTNHMRVLRAALLNVMERLETYEMGENV